MSITTLEGWESGMLRSWEHFLEPYFLENGNPAVRLYPYIGTSLTPIIWIISIWSILALYIIPYAMEKKSGFNLKKPQLVFDLFLAVVNYYLFFKGLRHIGVLWRLVDFTFENPSKDVLDFTYLYVMMQFVALLEAVFIVFQKEPITVLHVYDHMGLPFWSWIFFQLNAPMLVFWTIVNGLFDGSRALLRTSSTRHLAVERLLKNIKNWSLTGLCLYGLWCIYFVEGYSRVLAWGYFLYSFYYWIIVKSYKKHTAKLEKELL